MNFKEIFQDSKKRLTFAIALVVVFLFGCVGTMMTISHSLSRGATLEELMPPAFLMARSNATHASKGVVDLMDATSKKIEEANALDQIKQKDLVLEKLKTAGELNAQAKSIALDLSNYLKYMTNSLSLIRDDSARDRAYTAISTEITLVEEFLSYADSLDGFLAEATEVAGHATSADAERVESALREANEKAIRVNDLNKRFLTQLNAFDITLFKNR